MKALALLLDDAGNGYQQLLEREARTALARHGLELLSCEYAAGSAWAQVESLNRHLRRQPPLDGLLVMVAAGDTPKRLFGRVAAAGIATVFLNRVPAWIEDLRREHPGALLAAVSPRQEDMGEVLAGHALRLAPRGAFVLLVTGDVGHPTARARRDGFLRSVDGHLRVHALDGRWSAAGAERALDEWFRLGSWREELPAVVVCHNDTMASGARRSLAREAAATGRPELARLPLIGCDGLPDEGRAMVARGELAATVVVPPTTPAAVEILLRYWATGARAGLVELASEPFPAHG